VISLRFAGQEKVSMVIALTMLRRIRNVLFPLDAVERHRHAGASIGERVAILEGVIIDPSHAWHIEIGDDVTLAPGVHILAHDASTKRHLDYTLIGKVKIGNRVFVGAGSIILPGVIIGENVVIGAGSVVTRDIPSGTVAAGTPARVICTLQAYLEKRTTEMSLYPCFGEEYTIAGNVTDAMKAEMNEAMINRFGFVK